MKLSALFCRLLALVLALGAGRAGAIPVAGPVAQINGRQYVRLTDWARANTFACAWLKRSERVQLSRPGARLVLAVDSREATVNGVDVWLSFPLAARNGALYVARFDLQTTLLPLLSGPKAPAGARVRSICLDAGHGGKDPGNQVGSHQEKQFTLLLAGELRDELKRAGFTVSLTRSTDAFLELSDRPDAARQRKADLFVSLHFNSVQSGRATVQGAETYCLTPAGASSTNARQAGQASWCPGNQFDERNLFLAFQVQKALTASLGVEDRGVRRARFAVLRDATMPAVLIEAGYMSHPAEGAKIFTAAYRRQIAHAIAEGLLAYKRAVEQGN
jgi:N-acetylmuramoyl-L-alanine amidase